MSQNAVANLSKIHLVSLGCARNRVDSEVMLGSILSDKNWVYEADGSEADLIIINTCGFIEKAKEESIDHILEATEYKKKNPNLKVVVTGCLTQRYKTQLAKGLPEVDLFVGTDQFHQIKELIDSSTEKGSVFAKRTHYLYNEKLPRINTLAKRSAFVKVAEGCQHNCAFCIIPAIRGKLRSRPITSVVEEVVQLAAQGVIEINLIAQDLAAYGRERGQDELIPLLKELVKIEGIEWIRLLYVYPENFSPELIELIKNEPKILKYVDIPVQHASDSILKKMNRVVSRADLVQTITRLRQAIPSMNIRTSVMVGFPGETEEDFAKLLGFIEEVKFEHLGCFTYSQEEGTVAARLPDQHDEETKEQRQAILMGRQKEIVDARLAVLPGQEAWMLVEQKDVETGLWKGRLSFQAPEVDGDAYLEDNGQIDGSGLYKVRIKECIDFDFYTTYVK